MRAAALLLVASCTIGSSRPPVVTPPPPDPDRMPSAVLDHQDPGADTSGNPVLSRSRSTYRVNDGPLRGCWWLGCDAGGGDPALLIAVAWLVARRRRRPRNLRTGNTGETSRVSR